MHDRSISFLQFDVSREQPSWWLKFRSRWNKYSSLERDPNIPFHELDKWVCSCIEFWCDPHLLCRHLVFAHFAAGGDFPRYENCYRRYCYLLYIFDEKVPIFQREVVDAELDPWQTFSAPDLERVVHDWTNVEFQPLDGKADDIDPDNAADGPDDYLHVFKEKWARLVQNTEYLVEKEHDNQKFIEALDKTLYTFDRAIGQCMTALRCGQQQQTWANSGASMWLH
ncbi:hypothetical protein R1flu_012076 [Riccia fluitans]|uniref:SWIM-type domain-containing protein n=1 Tax=Riccia fluitans TaxID=41844 RepID=A0ABD1Z9L5_9MARC